ncbi:MAG TPA: urease subunit beta [Candidatus Tectomicrobia bacterium]|nr:urease subunit beta [Candidatus Tectomicrobia bacterium]
MSPGEISYGEGSITGNAGRRTVIITVENTSDRDIQVTSHYHFFEVNKRLRFDRAQAFGMHLDIPPGTTIRFEPGEERQVRLIEFAGSKRLIGFAGLTQGQANDETKSLALQRARAQGFLDTGAADG